MKVGIVARSFRPDTGRGIDRYAHELAKSLEKIGVTVQRLPYWKSKNTFEAGLSFYTSTQATTYLKKHAYDLIHFTLGAPIWKRFSDYPVISTCHDFMWRREPGLTLQDLYRELNTQLSHYADRIVCNSSKTYERAKTYFSNTKLRLTPFGVSNRFTEKHISSDHIIVGNIGGGMGPDANLELAIKGFCKYLKREQTAEFIIVGPRKHRYHPLKTLVKNLGISSSVTFTGKVSDEKLIYYYNLFDVFLYLSTREGFGFPILEAQKCGTPVITLKHADIPQEIKNYTYRIQASPPAVANAINSLINNQDEKKRQTTNAKKFTWRETAQKTLNIYKEIV